MRVHVTIEADPRHWRRPHRLTLFAAAAGLAIAVPVALANHLFSDVATSNPHHDDISAIALAGVTTGCGPGVYCPEDNVTRQQMASFLRRGFGRVAESFFTAVPVPLDYITSGAVDTVDITTGVPAGALTGANGFIKADAVVEITRTDATGCPCTYLADLGLDFSPFITDGPSLRFTVTQAGSYTFPLTGAIPASSGSHTVEVLVQGPSGATASGYVTATYFPFGPTGTDTGVASAATKPDR